MRDQIVFRSLLDGDRWKVTRDDKLVGRYPSQLSSQNAIRRLARAEVLKGNAVHAVFHRADGSVKKERSYEKVHGAFFAKGDQDGTSGPTPRPS